MDRQLEDLGGLVRGQSPEEAQLDQLRLARVEALQIAQGIVHSDDFHGASGTGVERFVQSEFGLKAAALGGVLGAGVIDQDLAHDVGCHGQEMRPVAVIRLLLAEDAEVQLVNQRGGLQGMARPFVAQESFRDFAEFGVKERDEAVERALVAIGQVLEKQCDRLVLHRIVLINLSQGCGAAA